MPEKYAKLLFGEGIIGLNIPDTVSILDMKLVEPLPDPEGIVFTALVDPSKESPLRIPTKDE